MRKAIFVPLIAGALAASVLSVAAPAQADAPDPSWVTCAQHTVPVTVPGDATTYHISGRMCARTDKSRGGKTVQLLVPGWGYDRNYYNPNYQPNTYSWMYAETSKGYSTFAIDRLGTGLSDKPPAAELTVPNEAAVVGQVVQALRAGAVGGVPYQFVMGVGHSLGAAVLQYLAGSTTGTAVPNFLVLEDFLNAVNPAAATALAATLYPASSDPAFAAAGLPTGYQTTMPGTRAGDFYYTPGADSAMIATDESVKQTGTSGEITTLGAARTSTVTHAISVPTLIAVGQYDSLDCNESISGLSCASSAAVLAREAGNYSPRACLSTYVVTNAGHDVDLHTTARNLYNYVGTWLDNYTINYTNALTSNGCLPF
jgi:pimeloyl-ACP methyl ester carboxylesterase